MQSSENCVIAKFAERPTANVRHCLTLHPSVETLGQKGSEAESLGHWVFSDHMSLSVC